MCFHFSLFFYIFGGVATPCEWGTFEWAPSPYKWPPKKNSTNSFPFRVTKNGIIFLRLFVFLFGQFTFNNSSLPWWKNHFKWLKSHSDCGWSFISPFQRVNNNWPPGLFWATFETSVRVFFRRVISLPEKKHGFSATSPLRDVRIWCFFLFRRKLTWLVGKP